MGAYRSVTLQPGLELNLHLRNLLIEVRDRVPSSMVTMLSKVELL